MSFKFLTVEEIKILHERNIARFGGSLGVRDEASLESAVLAPQTRHFYGNADVVACAATYGYHLCQAHAFVDGNKRIAAVACEIFMRRNGWRLQITNAQLEELFLSIASSQTSREQLEEFLRENSAPLR